MEYRKVLLEQPCVCASCTSHDFVACSWRQHGSSQPRGNPVHTNLSSLTIVQASCVPRPCAASCASARVCSYQRAALLFRWEPPHCPHAWRRFGCAAVQVSGALLSIVGLAIDVEIILLHCKNPLLLSLVSWGKRLPEVALTQLILHSFTAAWFLPGTLC